MVKHAATIVELDKLIVACTVDDEKSKLVTKRKNAQRFLKQAQYKIALKQANTLEGFIVSQRTMALERTATKVAEMESTVSVPCVFKSNAFKKMIRLGVNVSSLVRTNKGIVCILNSGKTEDSEVWDYLANIIGKSDSETVADWKDWEISHFDPEDELGELEELEDVA